VVGGLPLAMTSAPIDHYPFLFYYSFFFYLKNKQIFLLPFSCDISGPLFSSSVSENI
jgi:hypothetical protein